MEGKSSIQHERFFFNFASKKIFVVNFVVGFFSDFAHDAQTVGTIGWNNTYVGWYRD